MAHKLKTAKFSSPQDGWQFQLDLLALQREIQQGISASKGLTRVDKKQHETLVQLRVVLWLARRLGDAFAWLLLGLDRKTIHALGDNRRVAVSPEETHGTTGMTAIAAHLASEGWGFPIIHDATDCLRIGDITFAKPGAGGSLQTRTVEVKTRLLAEEPDDSGKMTYHYNITLVSPQPFDEQSSAPSEGEDEPTTGKGAAASTVPPRRRPPDPRAERQFERMSKAYIRQSAADNALVEIPGEAPHMALLVEETGQSHWPALRRIIRAARRDGYASVTVDNALIYIAIYKKEGIDNDAASDPRIVTGVRNSSIFQGARVGPSSIVIKQMPPMHSGGDTFTLPFYLYPIPWNALSDILRGRLVIVSIVNPAKVLAALESSGFEIELSLRQDLSYDSFKVIGEAEDESGQRFKYAVGGLSVKIIEMIYELKSVQYLIDTTAATVTEAGRVLLEQQRKGMGEQASRSH